MKRMRWMCLGMLLSTAWICVLAQDHAGRRSMHVETSFDVVVPRPVAETMKLFTPEGERVWAGRHWDPQYIYQAGPTQDAPGAVFTIQHGPVQAVWTVTRQDNLAREYEYAYFIPDVMITTIRVRFAPIHTESTDVHVTYARTALSAEGVTHVATMSEGDKKAGADWQSAIEKYLGTQPATPR